MSLSDINSALRPRDTEENYFTPQDMNISQTSDGPNFVNKNDEPQFFSKKGREQ
jgi:hypothetical protein